MRIEVSEQAADDMVHLPREIEQTFMNAKKTAEKNMEFGADPDQALEKYLSGNMHPILQETLGGDYRAWFIEGGRIGYRDDAIYTLRVLKKKEAEDLTQRIRDALAYAESILG